MGDVGLGLMKRKFLIALVITFVSSSILLANQRIYDSKGNDIGYVGSNGNGVVYSNDGERIGRITGDGKRISYDDGQVGRIGSNGNGVIYDKVGQRIGRIGQPR
jgi:rRNA processing protein Gar1